MANLRKQALLGWQILYFTNIAAKIARARAKFSVANVAVKANFGAIIVLVRVKSGAVVALVKVIVDAHIVQMEDQLRVIWCET